MRTYQRRSTCQYMPGPSSVTARRAFTNSSRARAVKRDSRSTPRIASTARRATSRTRPRTSTGSHPKVAEAPITRTCKWLAGAAAAALALGSSPAFARLSLSDAAQTYVAARAASMSGDQAPSNGLLSPVNAEERAFILLKFRRTAEAEALARQAVGRAGVRETRLRLAFADAFLAAGDRPRALMIIEGMGAGEAAARQRIAAGKLSGQGIDNLPEALSEVLMAFAGDLLRLQRGTPPIGLVQVARYANPQNSSATALLALLLAGQSRSDQALTLLRSVPASDALMSQVRDVQTRILRDNKNLNEAYQVAASAAAAPGADVGDLSRLGEVLDSMKRHNEAADAYGRA